MVVRMLEPPSSRQGSISCRPEVGNDRGLKPAVLRSSLSSGVLLLPFLLGMCLVISTAAAKTRAKKARTAEVQAVAPSPEKQYWVPAKPPSAHYRIEARLGLEGVNGKETITLSNTASRPLTVLALDWAISDARSITVKVNGQPISILNKSRAPSGATSSPLLCRLLRPLAPGARTRLMVDFQAGDIACPPLHEIKMKSWYPRLWWDGLAVCDSFEVKLVTPPRTTPKASEELEQHLGLQDSVNDLSQQLAWRKSFDDVYQLKASEVILFLLHFRHAGRCCAGTISTYC